MRKMMQHYAFSMRAAVNTAEGSSCAVMNIASLLDASILASIIIYSLNLLRLLSLLGLLILPAMIILAVSGNSCLRTPQPSFT